MVASRLAAVNRTVCIIVRRTNRFPKSTEIPAHRNPTALQYVFTVGATSYTGSDFSGKGGDPRASELRPGDHVRVAYELANRTVSCACDPGSDIEELRGIERGFAVMTAVLAFVAVLGAVGLVSLIRRVNIARSSVP